MRWPPPNGRTTWANRMTSPRFRTTPFREVTDIVIACQTRTVLARCLADRSNSVRASSQCPTPIFQKGTRLTDIVRALRIRQEWEAGLHSLCSTSRRYRESQRPYYGAKSPVPLGAKVTFLQGRGANLPCWFPPTGNLEYGRRVEGAPGASGSTGSCREFSRATESLSSWKGCSRSSIVRRQYVEADVGFRRRRIRRYEHPGR